MSELSWHDWYGYTKPETREESNVGEYSKDDDN